MIGEDATFIAKLSHFAGLKTTGSTAFSKARVLLIQNDRPSFDHATISLVNSPHCIAYMSFGHRKMKEAMIREQQKSQKKTGIRPIKGLQVVVF